MDKKYHGETPKETVFRVTAECARLEAKVKELDAEIKKRDKVMDEWYVKANNMQAEIERLSNRDGNATIQLCYKTDKYPFNRDDMKICDFGVADNGYVVESDFVNNLIKENKRLTERIKELEKENE